MLDNKVETFLTVCEEMNFTQAATKLHISQPAVTQQMKQLEDYYGIPLFEFSGKHFKLTPYGELIYQTLISMKNNDTYLMNQLNDLKNGDRNIYMGVTKTVGEYFISNSLASYLKLHPDINASVSIANTEQLLMELDHGEIDFAIVEGNFRKKDYEYQTLGLLDFVPVCSASHFFATTPHTLDDLSNEKLIIREPGSGTREILEKNLEKTNHSINDFNSQISIGNMHVIVDLIREDCGITFLYKKAVANDLKEKTLMEIILNDFHVSHEINVIIRKDNLQKDSIYCLLSELFDNSQL